MHPYGPLTPGTSGEERVERLVQASDRRVERRLVARRAGADQGSLDRRDDEAGESLGVRRRDPFPLQGGGDRRFPALKGGRRGCGQRGILGAGQGRRGDWTTESLRLVLDAATEHLAEHRPRLPEPALSQGVLARGADLDPLPLGRLFPPLALYPRG